MTDLIASPETYARQVDRYLRILQTRWLGMGPQTRILDLGCGRGEMVRELRRRGFLASGSDLDLAPEALAEGPFIATDPQSFRVEAADASFDVIISNQVLEHVMDLPKVLKEIRRLLRPGGVSLHSFPSRWCLVEPHVLVPLAGVLRARAYLRFWAQLGIRNGYQKGLPAHEVTRLNFEYLRDHTNYPTLPRLRHMVGEVFQDFSFLERPFLSAALQSPGFAGWKRGSLRLLLALRGESLYRVFWGRILWIQGW